MGQVTQIKIQRRKLRHDWQVKKDSSNPSVLESYSDLDSDSSITKSVSVTSLAVVGGCTVVHVLSST